jgi:hypothetical protein
MTETTDTTARDNVVANAVEMNARNLRRLRRSTDVMGQDAEFIAAGLVAAEDWTTMATTVALIATERKRLQDLENTLATALGKNAGKHIGALADGARYEVTKSADRKAWDHDDWKRDVRRTVTEGTLAAYLVPEDMPGCLVDQTSGEAVPFRRVIQQALTMAQAVHGSSAPKTTELRRLGLSASDYCESTPGAWRVEFIKPDTMTPDVPTTKKD